jgi:hypothetical protein
MKKLTCSYYMENNKAFTLINSGQTSFFFYCHNRFLPTNHKYRKSKRDFFVDIVERDVVPLVLSGEELYDVVSQYEGIVFDFQSVIKFFLV